VSARGAKYDLDVRLTNHSVLRAMIQNFHDDGWVKQAKNIFIRVECNASVVNEVIKNLDQKKLQLLVADRKY
jgi:hypothetical protein